MYRVVLPIWARRPDILKKENLWKTQIQKFKTPKQAIKFQASLSSHLWVYKVYLKSQKTISKNTNFFPFSYDDKNVSLFLNSDKQKVFVACIPVVFKKKKIIGELQKELS